MRDSRRGWGRWGERGQRFIRTVLVRSVEANRGRAGLWLPVALALGIFLYFMLRQEPPFWGGMAGMVAAGGLLFLGRRRPLAVFIAAGLFAVAAGFGAAQLRTALMLAPVLEHSITGALSGEVLDVRETERGSRVILSVERLGRLTQELRPSRVRVLLLASDPAPSPGSRIELFGRFKPPSGPVAPGAYDFQRALFFEGIGAVGFALTRVELLERNSSAFWTSAALLRAEMSDRIRHSVAGDSGAIAAALLVGDRDWISPETEDALREAGIAHLLAISGLHVGLVTGCVFAVVRLGLSLFARIALQWPTREIAALSAAAFATLYLLLSGAAVPTQRAYIMTLVVLLAVLIGRKAISMRLIAVAATLILLIRPEYVLGASFQLSFAAVTGLVAVYEAKPVRRGHGDGRAPQVARGVLLLLLSSLVASLATLPVALHHFQQAALYGTITNLAAIPLASFWIMPWGVAALVLFPVGLEALALYPMGLGIDAVRIIAVAVQGWPYAIHQVAASPGWVTGAAALSGLWLCITRGRLRGLSGPPLVAAVLLLGFPPWNTPTILVAERGRMVGVVAGDELVISTRRSGFEAEVWRRRLGVGRMSGKPQLRFDCDALGCAFDRAGRHTVVWSASAESLGDDCLHADILITRVRAPRNCPAPRLILGPRELRRGGAAAIWAESTPPRILYVSDLRGKRPWTGAEMQKD